MTTTPPNGTGPLRSPPDKLDARYWAETLPRLIDMPAVIRDHLYAVLPDTRHGRYTLHAHAYIENPDHQLAATRWSSILATGQGRQARILRADALSKPWKLRKLGPAGDQNLYKCILLLRDYFQYLGPKRHIDPAIPILCNPLPFDDPNSPGTPWATDTDLGTYLEVRLNAGKPGYTAPPSAVAVADLPRIMPHTANGIRKAVHRFYRDLYGPVVANQYAPWELIEVQRKTTSRRWLKAAQVKAILASTEDLAWRCLLRLISGGLDVDVARTRVRDDIRFSHDNWLLVNTPRGWIALLIDPTDFADLKSQMLAAGDNGPCFRSPHAGHEREAIEYATIGGRLTTLGDGLGIPELNCTRLMTYGAAEMLMLGINEFYVQRIWGTRNHKRVLDLRDDAKKAVAADPQQFRAATEIVNQGHHRYYRCRKCTYVGISLPRGRCMRCGTPLDETSTLDPAEALYADLDGLYQSYLAGLQRTHADEARRLMRPRSNHP